MNYIEEMKLQIEKQIEKEPDFSAVRMVGRQLTDIVGNDEKFAQLVCEDFANGHTVQKCEAEIKKAADKIEKEHHAKNNKAGSHCVALSFLFVDKIIREFFGLNTSEQPQTAAPTTVSAPKPKVISFADMLAGLE